MANPILNVELVCSLFLVHQSLAEAFTESCVEAALAAAGSPVVSQCSAPGSCTDIGHAGGLIYIPPGRGTGYGEATVGHSLRHMDKKLQQAEGQTL